MLLIDCSLNIHRVCVKLLDENCPGPLVKKEKIKDRITKLMDKSRSERETRKKPSLNFIQGNCFCLLLYSKSILIELI